MRFNTPTVQSRDESTAAERGGKRIDRIGGVIATVVLVACALFVLISLGNWQLRRLEWK